MGEFSGRRTGEPLEERIARLEDIEAIKNLKAKYAYYCDNGYDADGMAGLFVEDSSWESNAFGVYRGRDEVRRFISEIGKEIVWALHFMICPVVQVADDGQTATGSWYLIEFATMANPDGSRDPVVMTANYNDTFVRENGEWKFKRVQVHFHQVSNWDQAWVHQQFRSAG
ncbi:MAG TPA: nuclear transport factor 2 family protein [Candidatus Dormibacteraeota bacterium]|nr:nuclear transport factor 2 family protein [Candidatus Dormibacteraeota bacterium]